MVASNSAQPLLGDTKVYLEVFRVHLEVFRVHLQVFTLYLEVFTVVYLEIVTVFDIGVNNQKLSWRRESNPRFYV